MKFKPTLNRILLKVNEDSSARKIGGIEIPETVQSLKSSKCRQATVIASGNPSNADIAPIAVGQQVIINQYGGIEVEFEKEKFLVVTYEDIIMTEDK